MNRELEESRNRMIRAKVDLVAEVTDQVQGQVDYAREHLRGFEGRVFNGFGIYADWSQRKSDLIAAHAALGKALALMRETEPMTKAEYEAIDP